MKNVILILLLTFAVGCSTVSKTPMSTSAISSLNTKNLVPKKTNSDILVLKSSFEKEKIPNGLTVPEQSKVTSYDLTNSTESSVSNSTIQLIENRKIPQEPYMDKSDSIKIDWFWLIIYYLIIIHVAAISYVVYKRKLFLGKNPFLKEETEAEKNIESGI